MRFFNFKNLYFPISLFTLFVTVAFLPQLAYGQSDEKVTRQQKSEVLSLIEKAEQNPYRVSHIYFSGNIEIRDRVLRRQINKSLNEGDIFSRQNLYRGLKNLSKLKVIYAVHLEDVEVSLDEKEKNIDLTITVREKRRSN
jgi:outer membrane protein assembly factor BamA